MDAGMKPLTGATTAKQAWTRFIQKSDIVGVKLNCSGALQVRTNPEVASEIVRNLTEAGVPTNQIYLYDRFADQIASVGYEKMVPAGVNIIGIEKVRDSREG